MRRESGISLVPGNPGIDFYSSPCTTGKWFWHPETPEFYFYSSPCTTGKLLADKQMIDSIKFLFVPVHDGEDYLIGTLNPDDPFLFVPVHGGEVYQKIALTIPEAFLFIPVHDGEPGQVYVTILSVSLLFLFIPVMRRKSMTSLSRFSALWQFLFIPVMRRERSKAKLPLLRDTFLFIPVMR